MFGAKNITTFFGVPACDDLEAIDAKAAILGVPFATPYDGRFLVESAGADKLYTDQALVTDLR